MQREPISHLAMHAASTRRDLRRTILGGIAVFTALPLGSHAGSPKAPIDTQRLLERWLPAPRLAGTGVFRWFGLRIYDARLWIGSDGFSVPRFDASPFALELIYARSLDGQAIAERSDAEMARLAVADARTRGEWLASMRALFPDVNQGERLIGLHRPNRETRFFHDDRPLGAVEDPRFGRAFFGIWLDPQTSAPELRSALLGQTLGAAERPT